MGEAKVEAVRKELRAMSAIVDVLEPLSEEDRTRVLRTVQLIIELEEQRAQLDARIARLKKGGR